MSTGNQLQTLPFSSGSSSPIKEEKKIISKVGKYEVC